MIQHRFCLLSVSLVWALLASIVAAAENAHYDEVFDENGKPRNGYAEILPHYQSMSEQDKKNFTIMTKRDFSGDNALDPLPRLLSETEYDSLKKGVEQRGTALRLFLRDYFAGNKMEWQKIIPPEVLDRIVARSQDAAWQSLVNPDSIAFPYGPDIIRDAGGGWRVVEDNPGYIGGPGDLIKARETLLKRMPQYQEALQAVNQPKKYYEDLMARYRSLAKPLGGRVVLYSVPPYPDKEDSRLKKILHEQGVDLVSPWSQKKLEIDKEGAAWVLQEGKRERVGFLILNGEHHFINPSFPAAQERAAVEEAKAHLEEKHLNPRARAALSVALQADPHTGKVDLQKVKAAILLSPIDNNLPLQKKFQAKGLNEAILRGTVASNYSPGLDFIGDKEFYVYVDDLVRHYLKEEPILRNIPTERFGVKNAAGKISADESLLQRVFADPKKYVIKAVDGRGGSAVWVGAKIPAEKFLAVKDRILQEPERFIVQEYMPLSTVGDKIVDLRMISAVDSKGVLVSGTPWGRALPINGDGKVNISSQGREMTVMVVKNPTAERKTCIAFFRKLFAH